VLGHLCYAQTGTTQLTVRVIRNQKAKTIEVRRCHRLAMDGVVWLAFGKRN
jgi:hypothetical protein